MSVETIASRYAKSLIELAGEHDKLERVAEDVRHFYAVTQVRDFYLLLKSPIVHTRKKASIFRKLFEEHYDDMTMSFLDIILRKGREEYLAEIAEAFMHQYREIRKISTVKLTTAFELDDERLEEFKTHLRKSGITYPNIDLDAHVDPEIMGGFILEFDDKLYNASVSHQLEELHKIFSTAKHN